ncbi:MAG: RNA 2',3'-cyclic phosphodiesterase [Candidatus Bipolaricaulaceae bacterium]
MRLFFCIELREDVRRALTEVAQECRRVLGPGSWVPPENYHLTVRFLGETPEEKLPQLLEAGKNVAAQTKPFALRLDTLGGFPQLKAARVLWVGPRAAAPEFRKLCQQMEEAVQALGFPGEKKEALPHVTLARFKNPKDLREVLARLNPIIPEVRVEGLTLMRSELRPEGAKYTPVASWKFGG